MVKTKRRSKVDVRGHTRERRGRNVVVRGYSQDRMMNASDRDPTMYPLRRSRVSYAIGPGPNWDVTGLHSTPESRQWLSQVAASEFDRAPGATFYNIDPRGNWNFGFRGKNNAERFGRWLEDNAPGGVTVDHAMFG